jgi:integrase
MTETTKRLTPLAIKALKAPGRYADGGNLYVSVRDSGAKHWVFLYRWHGKPTEAGGGSIRDVSLQQARAWAADGRAMLAERPPRNPKLVWKEGKRSTVPTFAAMAKDYFESKSQQWRSAIHKRQVKTMLQVDCKPIADKLVNEITTDDVVRTVKAKQQAAPVTAIRLRGYIEQVLSAAQALGHIDHDRRNVATWRGHLDRLLPARPLVTHYAALPYAELPAFMTRLRALREDTTNSYYLASFGLEFSILCATRSTETMKARWSEIDLTRRIWTLLPHRMKSGRQHQVPLSDGAMAVLGEMRKIRVGEFVFPRDAHKPIGSKRFERLLEHLKCDYTTHGMRSCFRDWAGNETQHDRATCEEALSHVVGDETERAYRRSHALEKHRQLLEAWSNYLH